MINIPLLFSKLSEDFYDCNLGGCGLFASAVSAALDSIKVKHKIIVLCFNKYQLEGFTKTTGKISNNNVDNNYKKLLSSNDCCHSIHNHIVIKVGRKYYGTDGLYSNKSLIKAEISNSILKDMLKNNDLWNDHFRDENDLDSLPVESLTLQALALTKEMAA